MEHTIAITGLQSAPDECSPKRLDQPIRFLVELLAPQGWHDDVDLDLLVEDLDGGVALQCSGRVHPGPELSWAETTVPSHTLGPGRYNVAARVPGHDCFRSRHLMDVWLPAISEADRSGPDGPPTWRVHPGTMPRATGLYHVEQVRIQRADGSEPRIFRGDEPIRVITRLAMDGIPASPLIRVQFFSLRGELMVGTNNERWDLELGQGGRRVVTVEIDRLNLPCGRYLVTVGLWPNEGDPCVLEARHAFHEILVEAEEARHRAVVTHESWRPTAAGERVVAPPERIEGGEVVLELALESGHRPRLWLESAEGVVVASAIGPRLVAPEPMLLRWGLKLEVPPGSYQLRLDGGEREQRFGVELVAGPGRAGRWWADGGD